MLPWLVAHASVLELHESFRLGPIVCDFLQQLWPKMQIIGNRARQTSLNFIEFWSSSSGSCCWQSQQGQPYVVNGPLFLCLAVQALYLSSTHTVAIILNPAPAVRLMKLLLKSLSEKNAFFRTRCVLERVVCSTPEGIRGDTFEVGLVVAIQQRSPYDIRPGGHNVDEARLWISLSRFTVELNIYVQYLDWAHSGAVKNAGGCLSEGLEVGSLGVRLLHLGLPKACKAVLGFSGDHGEWFTFVGLLPRRARRVRRESSCRVLIGL